MMHPLGRPCMIYDAVSADEWEPETKLTGIKGLVKKARQHTLNSRRVVFEVAKQIGKPVDGGNFIVAHIGGGTDVSFFRAAVSLRRLDITILDFLRSGAEPIQFDDLLELAGKTPISELLKFNHGTGGLVSLCGTADIQKIQEQIQQGGSGRGACAPGHDIPHCTDHWSRSRCPARRRRRSNFNWRWCVFGFGPAVGSRSRCALLHPYTECRGRWSWKHWPWEPCGFLRGEEQAKNY